MVFEEATAEGGDLQRDVPGLARRFEALKYSGLEQSCAGKNRTNGQRAHKAGEPLNFLRDAGLLGKFKLSIEECAFTELVKCYVGNNRDLLDRCGEKCWPIFERQLASHDFRLLITLGVKTLAIINRQLNINLQIGFIRSVEIGRKKYSVLPIYHPSPINPTNHANNLKIFKRFSNARLSSLVA